MIAFADILLHLCHLNIYTVRRLDTYVCRYLLFERNTYILGKFRWVPQQSTYVANVEARSIVVFPHDLRCCASCPMPRRNVRVVVGAQPSNGPDNRERPLPSSALLQWPTSPTLSVANSWSPPLTSFSLMMLDRLLLLRQSPSAFKTLAAAARVIVPTPRAVPRCLFRAPSLAARFWSSLLTPLCPRCICKRKSSFSSPRLT